MAIVEYGKLDEAMERSGIKSGDTLQKPRMRTKLKQANISINRHIVQAGLVAPPLTPTSDNQEYLDEVANDWAAGLFNEEAGQRARQGRARGIFGTVDVMRDRAMKALKFYIESELDISDAQQEFRMERIEGDGMSEIRDP